MGEELAAIIRAEIQAKGPIPFSRWMELCLYHPQHGYYMKPGRKTGAGRDADFVTPPTLHPFFGTAIAAEVEAAWARAGHPETWSVLEYGGGDGTLAKLALDHFDGRPIQKAVRWTLVDRNPLHGLSHADTRIRVVAADLTETASAPMALDADYIVAVELLDALALDLWRTESGQWTQLAVGCDAGGFTFVWVAKSPPSTLALSPRPDGTYVDDSALGCWFTEPPHAGAGCIVDYATGFGAWAKGHAALPRGYRRHREADPLEEPGSVDITNSVDFAAVGKWLALVECEMELESMEEFLLRHGILDELNAIHRTSVEGASSYLRLRQLLLPTGLGAAFMVARYARKGSRRERSERAGRAAGGSAR